jgi:Spy/CpxP family protein refolding chaperone
MTAASTFVVRAIAIATLAAALLPATAGAQRGARGSGHEGAAQHDFRAGNRFARLGRAIRTLDLSSDQVRAMRALRDGSDASVRDLGRRILEKRREVDEALWGEARSVERARAAATEVARLVGERTKARTVIELSLFKILTPAQRAELRELRDKPRGLAADGRATDPRWHPGAHPRGMRRGGMPLHRDRARGDAELGGEPENATAEDDVDANEADPGVEPNAAPESRRDARGGRRMARRGMIPSLELTTEQQTKLREARRGRAPRLRELNQGLRDAQRAVDDALLADAIDTALVERLAAELGRAEVEREIARFELDAAMISILTPEQAAIVRAARRGAPHP